MRVGAIPYLNALPLLHGLPWEFQTEPPAALQASLLAGRFDLALCSITTALCYAGFYIVPGMGIGCRGAVASVRLVLHDGHTDIRRCCRIALDAESNTANLLCRVLLTRYYDMSPDRVTFVDASTEADAHLVIGDRALAEPVQVGEIDLGAVWSEWTGASFVFAAWLVRTPTIAEAMAAQLTATRDRNLAQLDTLIAGMPAVGALSRDRLAYLRHNISYGMDTEAVQGMRKFHAHLIALGLAPDRPLPFATVAD